MEFKRGEAPLLKIKEVIPINIFQKALKRTHDTWFGRVDLRESEKGSYDWLFYNSIESDPVPMVIITSLGETDGQLYVTDVTNYGFVVKESGSGRSSVELTWQMVGV